MLDFLKMKNRKKLIDALFLFATVIALGSLAFAGYHDPSSASELAIAGIVVGLSAGAYLGQLF